jgi:hypothetical protein
MHTPRARGSDAEKTAFLQANVSRDYRTARRFRLPDGCVVVGPEGSRIKGAMRWAVFDSLQRTNRHMDVLESIFAALGAPRAPLMVITAVVNGRPRIDGHRTLTQSPVGPEQ